MKRLHIINGVDLYQMPLNSNSLTTCSFICLHISEFLSTCKRESTNNSCGKKLKCGHSCYGFKNEKQCPPCLHENCTSESRVQKADEDCSICFTDDLSAAPVVMVIIL